MLGGNKSVVHSCLYSALLININIKSEIIIVNTGADFMCEVCFAAPVRYRCDKNVLNIRFISP